MSARAVAGGDGGEPSTPCSFVLGTPLVAHAHANAPPSRRRAHHTLSITPSAVNPPCFAAATRRAAATPTGTSRTLSIFPRAPTSKVIVDGPPSAVLVPMEPGTSLPSMDSSREPGSDTDAAHDTQGVTTCGAVAAARGEGAARGHCGMRTWRRVYHACGTSAS